MNSIPKKIRNDVLWQRVYGVVTKMYGKIEDIIANYPSEEWATASKLRSSAIDSLFYISQAIGNVAAEERRYEFYNARRNIFTMQSLYTFAAKQKFLELEPELIVELDAILLEIDLNIEQCNKDNIQKEKEELEPWLKKYRIWQKMQNSI